MSLTIYAVGDIMLGEQPLCNNFGVKTIIQKKDPNFLFKDVSQLFRKGDVVFGNLECPILDFNYTNNEKPIFFCAEPVVVDGLKNAHFNVLSVANNHIMEHGRDSFLHTISILKENDITPVGICGKNEILNIKGHRIAFLAYSFIEDNVVDTCYNKVRSENEIIEDIQKIKLISDIIIISLHWGYEYVPYPSPDQIKIGRCLIDAGADIILGGHPHITQSYEFYQNRPIIYSLGNFIFDHTYIPTARASFIVKITVFDSFDSIDVDIIPVIINRHDYHPQIVNPPQSNKFLKSVETIRNSFENRLLSDYIEFIGDYSLLQNKYKRTAKRCMKVQFVKSCHRYSLSTVVDIIKNYVNKQWSCKT